MFTLLSVSRDDQRKQVEANSERDRENRAQGKINNKAISDDAEADRVIAMPALKKIMLRFLKASRISGRKKEK